MKKPNRPGWYYVKDTSTGETIRMWWNGVNYQAADEVDEQSMQDDIDAAADFDPEPGELKELFPKSYKKT